MSLVRGTITRVYLPGFLSVDHSVRFKTSDLASRLNAIKISKKTDDGSCWNFSLPLDCVGVLESSQ